ncbi:hypothetical protein [Candidatus Karelsulcia muelleri]
MWEKGERSLIKRNYLYSRKIIKQLFKFSKQFKIPIINNNWNKQLNFIEFYRDIGKYFYINYMLNKDSVKKRLRSLSFTEFTYQLLQAYDFYYLKVHGFTHPLLTKSDCTKFGKTENGETPN